MIESEYSDQNDTRKSQSHWTFGLSSALLSPGEIYKT